jgi:undecaprenyl diphosphate synthase
MQTTSGSTQAQPADSSDSNDTCINTPAHVAIIMDGNGRWATSRGRSRTAGHRAGRDNIRQVIRAFSQFGVKYLTLFAFSTENWERPEQEVQSLLELLRDTIYSEVEELHQEGVRIRHLGRLDRLSPELQSAIHESVELTSENRGLTLSVAFDYGGRAEILEAVKKMLADNVSPDEVTEEHFASRLYTADLPDPDLIIRTAGEMRLSNFLLWQLAYAEYYVTPTYWPDFDEDEVVKAIKAYGKRRRRFGRVASVE